MTDTECTLCGLPAPDPPVTGEDVAGAYCCRGCLEVARTLEDPDEAADGDARAALDTGPDGDVDGEEAFLSVSGMHCATCEAFVEATATDHDGVAAAEASYPTSTVKLTYDPEVVDADDLPDLLDGMGYRARRAGEPAADEHADVGRLLVGGFFGMMTMLWYVLFLYPRYVGVPPEDLLMDLSGSAGVYLLSNVWVMATIVLVYTGFPILRGAYVSLRAGHPNMDLLVGLAATTAYAYSTAAMLLGRVEVYFDIAVVIVLVVSLGDYYEGRIKRGATERITRLTEERAAEARRRVPGGSGTETVGVDDLGAGDELVVRQGERVPVDGTVVEGTAAVDESLVTGESVPARVEAGDEVIGGGVVTDGGLVVRVGPDAASTVDRILTLLWDVQTARPGVQRLADRIAAAFVPLVVVLAVATTGYHLLAGATATGAFLTGLAVLVVSCPCALGLATPLAVSAGVREALDDGVVVTDASVFERATEADVVALDKTGTLTTGAMEVVAVHAPDEDPDAVLERAAAVEQFSSHPVAAAITERVGEVTADVADFERYPGRGVGAGVDGDRVLVGSPALFGERDWTVPDVLAARAATAREAGRVPSLVGWDGAARAVVVAGDQPRDGWGDVVDDLDADGRRVVVITGDSDAAAGRFRDHDGVDEVFAGVPPEAKVEVVERLRTEGVTVMVGDGSNDAPALAAADLGVALESGTAMAADAADAVVTTDDLRAVPRLFDVTAGARRRIRQNLGWAFCYNAVAVPLAVAGLLNPLLAAVAMAGSSLLVVANSARALT